MYGMGTYLCLMPVFDQRPEASKMIERGLNTEQHAAPGQYVSFLYNQGGALVKWFRNTFASAERLPAQSIGQDLYATLLAEMPEDRSRVMVLPHFTVTGPPDFISDSSGVMAGLKLETTRGEILKGLIEAMTFYIRASFETLPGAGITVTDFRAVGGGSARSGHVQDRTGIAASDAGQPEVQRHRDVPHQELPQARRRPGRRAGVPAAGSSPLWKTGSVKWSSWARLLNQTPANRLYTLNGLPGTSASGRCWPDICIALKINSSVCLFSRESSCPLCPSW